MGIIMVIKLQGGESLIKGAKQAPCPLNEFLVLRASYKYGDIY
jgi:hypothetical protein